MHRAHLLVPFALLAFAVEVAAQDGPFAELRYRCVGPTRGGRVTAVAGVAQRPGEFWMGATGGGVWKTTDFGQSWRNVSDGFFATPSIGAIRVANTDPDLVWVGTGSDGLRSNVIPGRGVYRSRDAGATWQHMGLEETGQIGAVEIHPRDPETVFVAAIGNAFAPNEERGVYRTRDGGRSWDKVLFFSETCGAVDLEFHPAIPDLIYACAWKAERKPWTIISGGDEGGVYRSTDGGDTWEQLANGLPGGIVGKSDLAVSFSDPDRVYVLIEAPPGKGGLYRSDDRGESFRLVSTESGLLDRPFYYCNVDADPTDADVVYVNSTRFYKSTDAGESWRRIRTPHGDNHDMWINRENPDVFVQGNDGGANVTRDGGRTWSTQQNQPTAELYQVAVDDRFPYWLYAGQQDNSTIRVPSLPPWPAPAGTESYWQSVGGCETGPAVPKPGDPDIVYANCKGRFGVFNFRTGQEQHYYVGAANMYGHNPRDLQYRFQRVSPIVVSPHDPGVVYHASQFLHRTTDEGRTWQTISPDLTANEPDKQVISGQPITRDITGEEFYSTIYEVSESPLQKGLIWVGANDGPMHLTKDGGGSWLQVTPEPLPPGGRVQTIEPSPHNAAKAYACVLRYQLGDPRPHVYRTLDYGATWKLITPSGTGVPQDFPARVVREDPEREGLLYLGTEYGMFVSFDDGGSWQPFQQNLPVTPVTDLVVHRGDLVMSTMGRSFWILDDLSPVRQWAGAVADATELYAPAPAYRTRIGGRRWGGGGGVPEYAPAGALLHYWIPEQSSESLAIEILDGDGELVRRFASDAAGEEDEEQDEEGEEMRRSFRRGGRAPRLSLEPGLHRLRWDLRRAGRGPLVVPGAYTVRLTADGKTVERTLEVRMDPRVAAEGITVADLREQEELILRVQAAERDARGLLRQVEAALEGAGNGGGSGNSAALEAIRAELETADGRYMQPMLLAQLRYLRGMIDRADQRPGQDAYQRIDDLTTWLRTLQKQFAELR